jgi:hypothetical protein
MAWSSMPADAKGRDGWRVTGDHTPHLESTRAADGDPMVAEVIRSSGVQQDTNRVLL